MSAGASNELLEEVEAQVSEEAAAAQRLAIARAQVHAIRALPGASAELERLEGVVAELEQGGRAARSLPRQLQSAVDAAANRRETASRLREAAAAAEAEAAAAARKALDAESAAEEAGYLGSCSRRAPDERGPDGRCSCRW